MPDSAIPLLQMMHGETVPEALRHLCVVGYKSVCQHLVSSV